VKEGDVILFTPEYDILKKDKWYGMNGVSVPKTILYTPSKLSILLSDYSFFKITVTGIFRTIKEYWKEHPFKQNPFRVKKLYDIRSFDDDNIKIEYLNSIYKKPHKKKRKYQFSLQEDSWEELKEYKRFFNEKNIKLFITPPSVLNESVDVESAKLYLESISKHSTIPILNNNLNYFFERNLFHDTNYHLNKKGLIIRTNNLINDLNHTLFGESKKKSKVFLSKSNFNTIELAQLKDKHNVKLSSYKNDSILVKPTRNKKPGFLRLKTNPKDYIGSIIKITIEGNERVVRELKFQGILKYDFDYVNKINSNTYVLYKTLSNTINSPKDFSFSAIGIGYEKETLSVEDSFVIKKFQIIEGNLNCNEVAEYKYQDELLIPEDSNEVYFKVKNFNNEDTTIKNLFNINSQIKLNNNNKYILKLKNGSVFLYDFYKDKEIFKSKLKERLKFLNSSNLNQVIEVDF
jgi:hypothetical protein